MRSSRARATGIVAIGALAAVIAAVVLVLTLRSGSDAEGRPAAIGEQAGSEAPKGDSGDPLLVEVGALHARELVDGFLRAGAAGQPSVACTSAAPEFAGASVSCERILLDDLLTGESTFALGRVLAGEPAVLVTAGDGSELHYTLRFALRDNDWSLVSVRSGDQARGANTAPGAAVSIAREAIPLLEGEGRCSNYALTEADERSCEATLAAAREHVGVGYGNAPALARIVAATTTAAAVNRLTAEGLARRLAAATGVTVVLGEMRNIDCEQAGDADSKPAETIRAGTCLGGGEVLLDVTRFGGDEIVYYAFAEDGSRLEATVSLTGAAPELRSLGGDTVSDLRVEGALYALETYVPVTTGAGRDALVVVRAYEHGARISDLISFGEL